jgi:hypothetical protein
MFHPQGRPGIGLWLLVGFLSTGACTGTPEQSTPVLLYATDRADERYMGIRLLGTLRLPTMPVSGLVPNGLSGLAWDEAAGFLYAVSDQGNLFHLHPEFTAGQLSGARFVAAWPLRGADGNPLRDPDRDAEGLALAPPVRGGGTELLISFEADIRLARYRPDGTWVRDEPLPPLLRNPRVYSNPNKALEAVTWTPEWGILLAPEQPLRGARPDTVPIVAADGRQWQYPLYPAPNSGLVALEALPDGSLLTLERAFVSLSRPLVIALRRTRPVKTSGPLAVTDIAVFSTADGWLLDNFEGLTRHRDRCFFMISDDNGNLWQNTLLVYFELLAPPTAGAVSSSPP